MPKKHRPKLPEGNREEIDPFTPLGGRIASWAILDSREGIGPVCSETGDSPFSMRRIFLQRMVLPVICVLLSGFVAFSLALQILLHPSRSSAIISPSTTLLQIQLYTDMKYQILES
jgi:hypothetical protein